MINAELEMFLKQAETAAAELRDDKSASNIVLLKKVHNLRQVDFINLVKDIAAASESEIFRAGVLAGLEKLEIVHTAHRER